ncbi:MAG TPA: aminotransferase class V-fold PLP-dependent enzyme, partial [Acidimicrobiales bacterium]|nr:aminotransferase class V-fold PLP-dependent enzyme [Acidimicrobiales bacterium]
EQTTLVSIGLVNGETGIIQDLETISDLIKELAPNALLHTDAVQGFPWLDIPTATKTADLVSIAAHKFGGPKGIGVLVAKEKAKLAPMQLGGGQEQGIRSGTQDVAGIVGMAAAAQQTSNTRQATIERVTPLRNQLANELTSIKGSYETGVSRNSNGETNRSKKIAGSCHVCFDQIESEALLFLLEQENILASAASSCSSGAQDPSHVLAAMGYNRELAGGSLRLSLGYKTSETDIQKALEVIPKSITKLRKTGS